MFQRKEKRKRNEVRKIKRNIKKERKSNVDKF